MERAYNDKLRTKTSLKHDRSLRTRKPQLAASQLTAGTGRAAEDLGSSFGPPKPATRARPSQNSASPDLDDDELLLTPGSSQQGSECDELERTPRPSGQRARLRDLIPVKGGYMSDGRFVKEHPEFKERTRKLPSFKKKCDTNVPPPTSTPALSQTSSQPNVLERVLGKAIMSSPPKSSLTRRLHDQSPDRRISTRKLLDPTSRAADASAIIAFGKSSRDQTEEALAPQIARPKARPVVARPTQTDIAPFPLDLCDSGYDVQGAPSKSRSKAQPLGAKSTAVDACSSMDREAVPGPSRPKSKVRPASAAPGRTKMKPARTRHNVVSSEDEDDAPTTREVKSTENAPRKRSSPASFPMSFTPPPPTTRSTRGKGKGKQVDEDKPIVVMQDDPIGQLSPIAKAHVAPTPLPSGDLDVFSAASTKRAAIEKKQEDLPWLAGLMDDRSSKVKGKAKAKPDNLEEFPMATQALQSIGEMRRLEREGGRSAILQDDLFPMDADNSADMSNLFMAAHVDPETLCPYCDDPLPAEPTEHLRGLLSALAKSSSPDPRPSNPLGRRAPMRSYAPVCQRHRFERDWLPRARANGWPTQLNLGAVRTRVEAQAPALRAVLVDVAEEGARAACVFWRELMDEIRVLGTRAAAGASGQFATFERAQPGYYGEQGALVIHQTLYNLFPPNTLDASLTHPLSPADFIQRVLVPEAGLALVREDTGKDRDAAVRTLRESAPYGVAMFPATGMEGASGSGKKENEDEGEQMVRERASARRREIEEEERMEERLRSEHEIYPEDVEVDFVADEDDQPAGVVTRAKMKRQAGVDAPIKSVLLANRSSKRRRMPVEDEKPVAPSDRIKHQSKVRKGHPNYIKCEPATGREGDSNSVKHENRVVNENVGTVKREVGAARQESSPFYTEQSRQPQDLPVGTKRERRTINKEAHKGSIAASSIDTSSEDSYPGTLRHMKATTPPTPSRRRGKRTTKQPIGVVSGSPAHQRREMTRTYAEPQTLQCARSSTPVPPGSLDVPIATDVDSDPDSDPLPQVVRAGTSRDLVQPTATLPIQHMDVECEVTPRARPRAKLQDNITDTVSRGTGAVQIRPGTLRPKSPSPSGGWSRSIKDFRLSDDDLGHIPYENVNHGSATKESNTQRNKDSWLLSESDDSGANHPKGYRRVT